MLDIISALTLAISANLDNILVGISYGANRIKIKRNYIIIIGSIISFVTFIAFVIGDIIAKYITNRLAQIISGGTLILIGIISIMQLFYKKSEEENTKNMDCKSALFLALTLSFNNFVISIVSSIGKISMPYTLLFTYIFSTAFLSIGNILGRKINSKVIAIISAVLLIILGILNFIN